MMMLLSWILDLVGQISTDRPERLHQGERFTGDGRPAAGYRDARAILVLGPGEEKEVRIACPFEPHRLVVDPDAKVLQLQRRAATVRF
jgi:hypothetical protein